MLVGEVNPLRLDAARSPATLSAGSPVSSSVMATKDFQVSRR